MAAIGEVTIELNGKAETLRCSLEAAKRVSGGGGGFMNVLGRLGAMDHDFYVMVVSAGLNKKPIDVDDAVYKTGLPNLTQPLATFVEYLTNGGRPLTAAGSVG
jgi:hypothetical protein